MMKCFGLFFGVCVMMAQQMDPDLDKALKAHQAGEMDAAIVQYRIYLKKKPGAYESRANLGAALARQGFFEEAIGEYKTALKSAPSNPGISYNLALAYYKTGDLTLAVKELSALRALVGEQPQVTLLLADSYLQLGQNKKAIELLEPASASKPEDLGIAYVMGMALLRDKQVDEGQKYLNQILGKGESAEALFLMGTSKFSVGDFPNALKDFQKAYDLNPQLPTVNASLGQALMATGDTGAATKAFERELAQNPNDFGSNLQMGVILKQDELFDQASKHFQRALRVRPGDIGVRYQIAAVMIAQNKIAPALTELEGIIKEADNFTEAHVSLATVYYRLKRKADGDRERAIVQRLNAEAQAKQPKGQPLP